MDKPVSSRVVHDGMKNAVVLVTGVITSDVKMMDILKLTDFQHQPKAVKIDDVVYSIQGKLTCLLWWKDKSGDSLMFPLEGRGKLDFSPYEGLQNPRREEWDGGIQLSTVGFTGPKQHFMIMLNLTKS